VQSDFQQRLILRDELQTLWQGQDIFALVQQLDGDLVRDVPGRQTLRFTLNGKAYYCKRHTGVGWGEILKNLLSLRLPVISARSEWLALNRLAELQVPSLEPVAYGERGSNPATRFSFIVTRELAGKAQLDDYLRAHPRLAPKERRCLLDAVAHIARQIHRNGINHRDLYLCHFLLDTDSLASWRTGAGQVQLFLVDLHRAQLRARVPRRWQVKDLASIYFSAMDLGVTQRDIWRFLQVYFDQPLAVVVHQQRDLLAAVARRADKLYRREQRLRARGQRGQV